MFKNQMKAKRRKTGDGGAKKNEKGNILERPVYHADLSQGRDCKASCSMAVLGHRQKFFNLF